MIKQEELSRSILYTIIYFDIFDYPLTSYEIWKWLYNYKCELKELVFCLEDNEYLKRYTENKNGFYFLKGRKNLLNIRKNRRDSALYKRKISSLIGRILRLFPFVKMICDCNSIGRLNLKENSDIDLFIIVKDGYIWVSRFLITLILQILFLRRHGNRIKNRACLSFYITDKHLNIQKLSYDNDIYFYYWIVNIVPIFDNNTYSNFIKSNNWILDIIPNSKEIELVDTWVVRDSFFSKKIRKSFEFLLDNAFGSLLNKFFRFLQMKRILSHKNSKYYTDSKDVIVSDVLLKFHEKDMRKYYRDLFFERINRLNIDNKI